jgi:two-component system NtrC family response regulator
MIILPSLLIKENRQLSEALSDRYKYGNIIGKSKPMLKIYDMISKVAQSKASVMITGPSGTGKELIAKAIHYNSPRKSRPFISLNCGALTETLLESELFGHERGAFTGAIAMKKGRFELADDGTLFLDEVGEMPPSRVGGTKTIKVDVRILAASNRKLKEDIDRGIFREDLFYRLNVVQIEVPPLKDRIEDLPFLTAHFIEKFQPSKKKKIELSPDVWKALYNYSWPGNIRELENTIERAVVMSSSEMITMGDLPEYFVEMAPLNLTLPDALEKLEKNLIRGALEYTNQVQSQAAEMLGISRRVMHYKMKKYGLLS